MLSEAIFNDSNLEHARSIIANGCQFCHTHSDIITWVTQLGRLDLISMTLGIIGVSLAIFGLFGFGLIHRDALKHS